MSRTFYLSTMIIGLILSSCSGRQEKETQAPEKPSTAETSSTESGNPLTAPVDYLGAVANAKNRMESKLAISSLTQAIQLFKAQEGRLPASLDELVSKQYVRALPQLPRNLKYQYDPNTGQVDLVAKAK